MKKFTFIKQALAYVLTAALILAPFPAIVPQADAGKEINPIIASGTVAANLLRFSNATGAYFVDTTDATLAAALAAAVKHNDIVEVLDGSKRAIRFVAKSQGTGETESEKFVAPLILQEGWTDNLDGSYTGVTTSFGVYRGTPVLGALYKPAFTIDIRTAGTVVAFVHTASGTSRSTVGTFSQYLTSNGTTYFQFRGSSFSGVISGLSFPQVTAPSTSGVYAQKYPGGADGFSQVEAGFDYNSSTGYSWRVVSSVPNGRTVPAPNYNSDFSAGTDSWVANGGAGAGNIDSIGGEDDWYRFTVNSSLTAHSIVRTTPSLTVGKKFTATFKYYIPTQSDLNGIRFFSGNGNYGIGANLTTLDAVTTYSITFTSQETAGLRFYALKNGATDFQDAGGDDVFYIKDIVILDHDAATVTSGTLHLDTTSTAMFFHDSLDFSAYAAGTEAKYLLAFYAGSTLVGAGYGGAVGGGEALGSELLDTWINGATYPYDTFITSGKDITSVIEADAGRAHVVVDLTIGKIYKGYVDVTLNSGSRPGLGLTTVADAFNQDFTAYTLSAGANIKYFTHKDAAGVRWTLYQPANAAGNWSSVNSLEPLTDVPATGLILYEDPEGTTRGLSHTGTGNVNGITTVRIYRVQ